MTQKLLAAAPLNTTGTEILDVGHRMNVNQTQLFSIYTWGTLGAGATVHVDALPEFGGATWVSAAQIDSTNFNKVLALQVRAIALRGRVAGGDGTTAVTMVVL